MKSARDSSSRTHLLVNINQILIIVSIILNIIRISKITNWHSTSLDVTTFSGTMDGNMQ